MSRFSIKSILLGIGIGIVFMSVVSLIYIAGTDPTRELTAEDIAKIAERYDLVKRADVIKDEGSTGNGDMENTTASPTPSASPSPAPSATPSAAPESAGNGTVKKDEVLITINEGATSESIAAKLHKAGLIDDEDEFVKLLGDLGLEDKIQVGSFKIPEGTSKKEIAGIITR